MQDVPPAEVILERGSCPEYWYSFKGRCFRYVASHLSWSDAEQNCLGQDANLASIHYDGVHNFVEALIKVINSLGFSSWFSLSWF